MRVLDMIPSFRENFVLLENLVNVFRSCDEHIPRTTKVNLDRAKFCQSLFEVYMPHVLLVDIPEKWYESVVKRYSRYIFREMRRWQNPASKKSIQNVRKN
jgi:hypothetical protein